jgi:LysR family nitrogen assimilation transcriptional regulator
VALPSVAQLLAPVLLRRFRDEHPQVRLVIREGLPVQIQEWILHGRTDMGIQYSVNQTGAIAGVSLVREQLHLIGSSRLPRLPAGGIRVQRLGRFPLVLTSTWHVIRRDLERAFAENDVRSNVLAEVDSVAVVKELVRHGFAYGILPKWAVFQEVQQKQLAAVPIRGLSGWTELMLMWLKTRTLSPAACELRNVVIEETAKLCELGWGQSVK